MPAKKPQAGAQPSLNPARGRKILKLRKSFGENQTVFGERFNVEQATVSRWEQGYPVAREHEEPIARFAGMSVAEFFHSDQGPRLVPIVGNLTTGAKFKPAEKVSPGSVVEHVMLSIGDEDQVAVRVEDDSMFPVYRKGDVIVAKRLPKMRTSDAIGADCIVVSNGLGYVRTLRKGSRKGLYSLRALHVKDDIEDAEVEWVAPIDWIKRAR